MGLLLNVALIVGFISFVTFVLFFGRLPALRQTPIGALHRLLAVHVPQCLYALDLRVTDGRLSASSGRWLQFLWTEKHPTILVFFIALLSVSEILYLPGVFPTLDAGMKLNSVLIVSAPYIFLFLSAVGDPGFVFRERQDFYKSLYSFDHTLFHPGQICRTCQMVKPARSKHCSLCGFCVGRADHHCAFINNCVGYGNMHWFILLLVSTAILTTAGAILGFEFMLNFIQSRYPDFTMFNTGLSWGDYLLFWRWALQENGGVGGVSLLCFCTTPLVVGLLVFNFYQIWAGITTNESGKWSDFKLDIAVGNVYMRSISLRNLQEAGIEVPNTSWPNRANKIAIYQESVPPNDNSIPGEGSWERVDSIHQLQNLYDIGFLGNLADVFLRRDVVDRLIFGQTGAGSPNSPPLRLS